MELTRGLARRVTHLERAMKGDDYSSGRHFWTHFWCGLIIGGALGAWISWDMFQSRWASIGLAAAVALLFAYCAGKWGDTFWYWVLRHWS